MQLTTSIKLQLKSKSVWKHKYLHKYFVQKSTESRAHIKTREKLFYGFIGELLKNYSFKNHQEINFHI